VVLAIVQREKKKKKEDSQEKKGSPETSDNPLRDLEKEKPEKEKNKEERLSTSSAVPTTAPATTKAPG